MSEKRKYRCSPRSRRPRLSWRGCVATALCGTSAGSTEIAETLYYQWRDRLLEGGKAALATPRDKPSAQAHELAELKKKVGQLERALGRRTYELEIAGELSRDWE